jgi:acetylornithine deacetylase
MSTSTITQQILQAVDDHRAATIDLLADLVRIPSVNRQTDGDELACQHVVAERMQSLGLEIDVFEPDSIPGITAHPGWQAGRSYTDRPNVVGVRRGAGQGRSILFLAHVDVVPEGPHTLWRHGPFNPVVENGALVGRGSNDDKGGLAALIMALRCVEAAGYRPAGDVILASVVDEESGGANGTLATLLRGYSADAAIYCDGLDLDIHIANLGGGHCRLELQLRPDVVVAGGAIRAAELLQVFYHDALLFARERTARFRADPRYAATVWPEIAVRVDHLAAGAADGSNPGSARLDLTVYILPDEEPEQIRTELTQRLHRLAERYQAMLLPPTITWPGRLMPPSATPADHPFVDEVATAFALAVGKPALRNGMPMSDLFQFNRYSPRPMPTVALGPGRWAVPGGAHEPNESILIDEHLIPMVKILALVIVAWCGVVPR